jgi:hypothetical protein
MVLGCIKTVTETRVEYIKPEIPTAIISECDPMPTNNSISTNGDLLMAYISLQSSYVVCSSKVTSIANILQSYDQIYTNSISLENEESK